MRTALAPLALVATALAGCLASPAPLPPPVDQALHEVGEILPLEFAVEDGSTLRGHVYLPDGEGPFATVLLPSPYWDNLSPATGHLLVEKDGQGLFRGAVGENLTRAGFAVAAVSLRGTGQSDGCFDFMNPQDGPDLRTVVEDLAAEPWSNGAVGTYGGSYGGWAQDVLLRDPPPQLKAVVPYSSVLDLWSLTTRHGAPLLIVPLLTIDWTLGTGLNTFAIAGPFVNGRLVRPDARADSLRPDHLCPGTVDSDITSLGIMADGDKTEWWQARDNQPGIAQATVPTFIVHGLTDGEGHIAQLDGRWHLSPAPQRWLIGQWGHSSQLSVVEDFPQRMVQWFDHQLRRGPDLQPTGIVEYQDDHEGWHTATSWPPAGASVDLHLAGTALAREPGGAPQTFAAVNLGQPSPALCSPDQVLYASPPIAEDVLLAGHFTVNVSLVSTVPDANFAAYLYHTGAAGPACPDDGAEQVRYALTDLRHRGHLEVGRDFPVGTPERVVVLSVPFATPVKAGERLVLGISGSDIGLQPKATQGLISLEEGMLTLNVAEGELRFEDEPAAPLLRRPLQ